MMKYLKLATIVAAVSFLAGCTGHVYNAQKNCSYDYLLHPDISISKIIGGCGPVGNYK